MAQETLTAVLQLELSQFTGALQTAQQQLQSFAQSVQQQLQQVSQAFQSQAQAVRQATQAQQGQTQATQQASQSNQQLVQAVQQATQGLNTTTVTLTQATQANLQFVAAVQQLTQRLATLPSTFTRAAQATNAWTTALSVAAGLGIEHTIEGVIRGLLRLATESLHAAARMQDLHIAFKAIEGSSAAANATLTFLFTTAQRLGLDFEKVTANFRNFEAAAKGTNLEGANSRRVFENIAQGARTVGVSGEQMQTILQALDRMMARGTVTAMQLHRQLALSLPGAIRLLAEGFGVTRESLEQMVRSGILPADAAIVALSNSMGKLGGEDVASDLDRLSTTFAQLKNEAFAWMTSIGLGIGTILKPWLDTIIQISSKIRELFSIPIPGVTSAPGAGRQGWHPLYPGELGTMPPSPYMPSEFERDSPYAPAPLQPRATQWPLAPSRYTDLIQRSARANQLDPGFLSQLIRRESDFDPFAVSSKGARGLGQIMPETGQDLGLTSSADFFNPSKNIAASARYVRQLRETLQKDFGSLDDETQLVLAAYNAGIGHVEKAIRQVTAKGGTPTFEAVLPLLPKPEETGPFVKDIFGTGPQARPATEELQPLDFITKNIEKTLQAIPQLQTQLDTLIHSGMNFGGVLGGELQKEIHDTEKEFAKVAELLARFPELAKQLTPEQREQLELAAKQVAILREEVNTETGKETRARQTVTAFREREKLTEQRAKQELGFEEEIQRVEALGTKSRVDNLRAALDKQHDLLVEHAASEDVLRRHSEAAQLAVFQLIREEAEKAGKVQLKIEEEIQKTVALGTKTRVDDFKATMQKQHDILVELGADETQLARQEAAALVATQRRATEEIQKEWDALGKSITSTLTNVFFSVLKGTKDLWEGIRDAFLKLLAQLAADALTHAVIIPVIMGLVGVLGGRGGGGLQGVPGADGAAPDGTTQGVQGQGSSPNAWSLVQTGYGIASLGSRLFGGPGVNSLFKGIANIPLESIFGGGSTFTTTAMTEGGLEFGTGTSSGFLGGATLGGVFGGVTTGITVGMIASQLLSLLGLHGTGNQVLSGAAGGAVGGAMIGSIIPGIGTLVGGIVGALVGALGGWIASLFGGKDPSPSVQIKGVQPGRVSYDPTLGLQITQPFAVTDIRARDIGPFSNVAAIQKGLSEAANLLFKGVVDGFQGAEKQVKIALVEPMNRAAQGVKAQMEAFTLKGDDISQRLQTFITTDMVQIFKDQFGALTEAVSKINPIVKAFNVVIDNLQKAIDTLKAQQKQFDAQFDASTKALQEGHFTPAQLFGARQKDLQDLLKEFADASPAKKLSMVPHIQQLVQEIFQLGKQPGVLSDNAAVVQGIQQQIAALEKEVPTTKDLPALEAKLAPLRQQLAEEQAKPTAELRALQEQLTQILADVKAGADQGFQDMQDALHAQIDIANQQVDLLVASLSHLENVDSAVATAVQVLHPLEALVASTQDTSLTAQQFSLAVLAQVTILSDIASVGRDQLNELRRIAGGGAPGSGPDQTQGPGAQHGMSYVPRDMPVFLHQGERVIPAYQNGRNGGDIHIHVNGGSHLNERQLTNEIIRQIEARGRLDQHRIVLSKR